MLATMPRETPTRRVAPATAGSAIRARRNYLGLKQEDIVERSNHVINMRLLSRLENNHKSPASLTLTKYNALVAVLQWTREEFMEATGVAPTVEELPDSVPYRPSTEVPIVGTVSAGLSSLGGHVQDAETLPIDLTAAGLPGINPNDLVWLRVNGDSMVSDYAARHVPQGSLVLVEVGAIPRDGELVVAWLDNRDMAVLKQYRESGDPILRSYNPSGPVFRLSDEPVDVRGVVKLVQFRPGV